MLQKKKQRKSQHELGPPTTSESVLFVGQDFFLAHRRQVANLSYIFKGDNNVMKRRITQTLLITSILLSAIFLSGCLPVTEPGAEEPQATQESAELPAEAPQLATSRVSAKISQPGRAVVTGHNNTQFFVDAESESAGLHEIDTLLAAQVTCGVFVAEKAAQELDIPLTGVTGTAVFDANKQQVQVYLDLPGADGKQVLELANNFRQRCPIYTTLSEARSVEFTPGEQFKAGANDTAVVTAELFRFGGANVTANDHTFVMDSVPPLDGPNEELNPLDMMLGGLATCSTFIYEREVPTANVSVTVEGDFDPTGVRDLEGPNPRILDIRVAMLVDEYDEVQAKKVEDQIKEQCYLPNILTGTVNFDISTAQTNS